MSLSKTRAPRALALAATLFLGCATLDAQHTSKPFAGPVVKTGTVSCSQRDGKLVLTLSDDFVVPAEAPAPHWQVVDSRGNAYLLERLVTKGDVLHKSVTVPDHVRDVAKVQIWCAWAEALLGETELDCAMPREAASATHRSSGFAGPKADKGFVTHHVEEGRSLLTLSPDFVVPETPAPHWRLIDSRGRAYLLNRLVIKGDVQNRTIEVPAYVPDVAKVQIWCAWAETVLGEASFQEAVL